MAALTNPLAGMTQEKWDSLTAHEREAIRDYSGLSEQLKGLEGYRVEVVDEDSGRTRRFIVGHSTGWRPCHLELVNSRSRGGDPARTTYRSVRSIERVR